MVYHEIRKVGDKKKNYLVFGERLNKKILKKSKFIGYGSLKEDKIKEEKEKFEFELALNKNKLVLNEEQIKEVESLKKRYNHTLGKLDKEELNELEKAFFTELTYNSNAIEGNSLSLEETSLILNEGLSPEGKTLREIHEAKNHKEAINLVKDYEKELDELFILKVHSIILKNISERFAGKYRETNVRIFGSDARFPDSSKVQQMMKNLIYWYDQNKKELNIFELAAIFSMKLVSIHPFIDGNGRISRLIMNFILRRNKYPWINIYQKQRAEYLRAVRKANDENYSEIIPFLLKTLKENLDSFKL